MYFQCIHCTPKISLRKLVFIILLHYLFYHYYDKRDNMQIRISFVKHTMTPLNDSKTLSSPNSGQSVYQGAQKSCMFDIVDSIETQYRMAEPLWTAPCRKWFEQSRMHHWTNSLMTYHSKEYVSCDQVRERSDVDNFNLMRHPISAFYKLNLEVSCRPPSPPKKKFDFKKNITVQSPPRWNVVSRL